MFEPEHAPPRKSPAAPWPTLAIRGVLRQRRSATFGRVLRPPIWSPASRPPWLPVSAPGTWAGPRPPPNSPPRAAAVLGPGGRNNRATRNLTTTTGCRSVRHRPRIGQPQGRSSRPVNVGVFTGDDPVGPYRPACRPCPGPQPLGAKAPNDPDGRERRAGYRWAPSEPLHCPHDDSACCLECFLN